jgi:Fur family ferric uptake transcriptional regulator
MSTNVGANNRDRGSERMVTKEGKPAGGAQHRYDQTILAGGLKVATALSEPVMTHAEELKSSGLKATLPRIKILEVFQSSPQRHMTAEDVFKILLAEGSDVGLATVYRVLMQFEQAGLLSRNHFETGKSVFELNEGKHHDHLVCLDCGRVEEFFDAEIEKRQKAVAQARGFELQEHSLSLYASCTKKNCPHRQR